MQPVDIQPIGNDLAIKWDDATEDFLDLKKVRISCPCASCRGETDVMGNVHKGPKQKLAANSTQLLRIVRVGGYAVQLFWGDGHSTGIYSWDLLKKLSSESN